MRKYLTLLVAFAAWGCAAGPAGSTGAEGPAAGIGPPPAGSRWERAFHRFEEEDRESLPSPGCIVFLGSSSLSLWSTLAADMEPLVAVNRGFGGSTMADALAAVDRFVLPYRPQAVVVYAGDNDTAARIPTKVILYQFKSLVGKIRKALPATKVYFLSIKPSPRRWEVWVRALYANRIIASYCKRTPEVEDIDVSAPLLDDKGDPHAELYVDGLHLNAAGYHLWAEVVRPVLFAAFGDPERKAKARKLQKVIWRRIAQKDMDDLLPLNFPVGATKPTREVIGRLIRTVADLSLPFTTVAEAYRRLVALGYPAVPMVINLVIRLDYTREADVKLGAHLFRLLGDMCNGHPLVFHEEETIESEGIPPWQHPYDIRWNRIASIQWHRFWVKYGTTRTLWERTLCSEL